MSDVPLWCLIHRDSAPFQVTSPAHANINCLKILIHEVGINECTILAKDLILWKVRML